LKGYLGGRVRNLPPTFFFLVKDTCKATAKHVAILYSEAHKADFALRFNNFRTPAVAHHAATSLIFA